MNFDFVTNIFSSLVQYKEIELFIASMLGATFIPIPTDPLLIASLYLIPPLEVLAIAVAGSTVGSCINYFIGLKGIHNFLVKRNRQEEKKAEMWFAKWGQFAVLIHPWIPFLGDPMMIAAGALKMNFLKFLGLVIIAKIVKTAVVIYLFYYAGKLFTG